ncbi:hypothetical protein J2T60_001951 [Natronospira proteinivora]|uniref:Uncharacterized protein n=1 Tax=Natronospira proteinivora TaxID=1807133 RepID=A0ABT1G9M4_9GAMM|nr:hypothetical protein [Natronospira proteinivora]MCP1727951.1 hypothetical protein [Natronospira proteinivora]
MDDQERTRKNRRRARNWALAIGGVAIAFYVGIFFLIHARY